MEKWKPRVSPACTRGYAVGGGVYIHRRFYTPFITARYLFYFCTCVRALSPMTVHNPHELSTDLSTLPTPFPHARGSRVFPRPCRNGGYARFVDSVYNSARPDRRRISRPRASGEAARPLGYNNGAFFEHWLARGEHLSGYIERFEQ